MLNNWFYSHPTWMVGVAVCVVLVAVSLAGLALFHRLVGWQNREHDTSMTGLSYALAGGIYAVVLAFVAVGVYQAMDKSNAISTEEANALSSLSFGSAGLPGEAGHKLREDVAKYIDTVTKSEWPKQQAYDMADENFAAGWAQLRDIGSFIANFEPQTQGQMVVKTELLRASNELFSARKARLLAANAHLPDAVWQMLVIGLIFIAVYVYLFGPHSYGIHMATTAMTMISVGLVFTLVIALDYPFRGDLSVSDEAFVNVRETTERAFEAPGATHGHSEHASPESHEHPGAKH